MQLAHISDTHLGFRAYNRATAQGFNQREQDVMLTFKACLEAIAQVGPDLIVHSGDLFHVVRPSNATIIEAYKALIQLQKSREGRPFVIIGGNHDTPRTSEVGNILNLYRSIEGVTVVPAEATLVDLPSIDSEVLCVPSQSLRLKEQVDWVPRQNRRFSVLTLHGVAAQVQLPGEPEFDVDQVRKGDWTYVALGDFHKHQPYGANICYAGSTDFTSTNIWEETDTPKGWVLFDTQTGILDFRTVATRAVIDLPVIDADGLSPEDLSDKLVGAARWYEDMPIVRQVVRNLPPEIRAKISIEALRTIQARALDYRLQTVAPSSRIFREGAMGQKRTLETSWREHVEGANMPGGVARSDLCELGLELLEEVKDVEAAAPEA